MMIQMVKSGQIQLTQNKTIENLKKSSSVIGLNPNESNTKSKTEDSQIQSSSKKTGFESRNIIDYSDLLS